MALSWNEIKERAQTFSKEWADETSENAEAKTFWDDFFQVFGLNRRRVASFEYKVTKTERTGGFIDLLWKGQLLVEHKSAGRDLERAFTQAKDYFPGLKDHELPKFICVCNFQKFRLIDLDENEEHEFELRDLVNNVQHFAFIAGYKKKTYKDQDPVNIEAAYLMGKLHDELKNSGYDGHELEVYLVRILFCLFAEDTTIFDKDLFRYYIENKTKEDGSDLGSTLAQLFQILNSARDKRSKLLDEDLNAFPYVNGKLFEEPLPIASFNTKMRETLLECSALDWTKISPAIFGSLFQSVKDETERRNLGAHYTSEKNIMKLIKPLFLDELYEEFEKVRGNKKQLMEFHKKLSTLKFLDPACGCGNFLVITYRELRILELKILKILYGGELGTQQATRLDDIVWINIDQFYGIEIDEWPARISEVAMWLIDHQMNMMLSVEFGHYFVRLPLEKTANIVNGNALRMDWNSLIQEKSYDFSADVTNILKVGEPVPHYNTVNVFTREVNIIDSAKFTEDIQVKSQNKFDYIFGNPPFSGAHVMNKYQKSDLDLLFADIKGTGVLDYVTAWFLKAAQLIQNTKTRVAFVATNSVSQGEQVGILWNILFSFYKIKINFAHRTFRWNNEAKGVAGVHVVIIGFGSFNVANKVLFEYQDINGEPLQRKVSNINPNLVESDDILIQIRREPISIDLQMYKGSQPTDGGYLLLSDEEKKEVLEIEPESVKYIKRFLSAREYINGINRWCFWLVDIQPKELKKLKYLKKRVELVKELRFKSKKLATRKWANRATLFTENRQPDSDYVLIPSHSSENRDYIPIGFQSKHDILNNSCFSVPNADLYHFGVLTSEMHMAWVKYTCGRLESRYRYSNTIVYNNYPWPLEPTEKKIVKVKEKAKAVLVTREKYPDSSLADLYDPLTMPPDLVKAHKKLDRAVDICYRPQPFTNESFRMEFLFDLYKKYTEGMFVVKKKKRKQSIHH